MDNGDMMELIKARFDLARINRERFVFFTPREREQVRDWLNQQQKEIERLQQTWIPVSERLPEEDENVLVLIGTECSVMRIVNRDKTDVWHWDGSYCMMWANWNDTEYADICDASHWMPLPKPPKKDGDGERLDC